VGKSSDKQQLEIGKGEGQGHFPNLTVDENPLELLLNTLLARPFLQVGHHGSVLVPRTLMF
jgi:hypothetical protein